MPETSKIAEIAEKVSDDIFKIFGWVRRPPRDRNWACCTEQHKKATHPSDVVFSYEDPIEHRSIFVTTDLKSYARGSIGLSQVKKALKDLAMTTECAAKSAQWQDLYVNPAQDFKVVGLLFIYNHDGGFHREFKTFLKDLTSSSVGLRRWVRLFAIGPSEIDYLITVANDIKCERGHEDRRLPEAEFCKFFYPDLVRVRVKTNESDSATLETLTGPWQILRYTNAGKGKNKSGYYVYYSGSGAEPEEFKYIFDYLFRHHLVNPTERISIRMPVNDRPNANLNFEKAKEQYALDFFPYVKIDDIKERLSTISFARINTAIQTFSELDLGME